MVQISIIVPVFNAEKTIRDCIESILNQSYKQFELILLDDGSTDNSGYICDEYKEKDPRIVVVHHDNVGVSKTRNIGIDISQGKCVAFVDSDDELLPGFLNEGMSAIQCCDIFYSGYIRCDYSGFQENRVAYPQQISAAQLDEEAIVYLFQKNYIASCCCKIYSKEMIGNTRFNEKMKFGEDLKFNIDLLYKNPFIVTSDKCFYKYKASDNSLTSQTDIRKCYSFIDTYCSLYEYGNARTFSKDGRYYSFVDNRLNDDLITVENMILKDFSSWISKYRRIRCLCRNKLLVSRLRKKQDNYTNKYAIKPFRLIISYWISQMRRPKYDS